MVLSRYLPQTWVLPLRRAVSFAAAELCSHAQTACSTFAANFTHCLSVRRSVVPLGAERDPRHWGAEFMLDCHLTNFAVFCARWNYRPEIQIAQYKAL